jgi:L-lactate dehydrogenase complex protein LldG
MTEKEFLTRVANRLGRSAPVTEKPAWKPSLPLPNIGPTDPEALVERFQAELAKLSGTSYRVGSAAEVAPLVLQILAEAGAAAGPGTVVRWDDPTLQGLGLDEALSGAGFTVVPFRHGADRRTQIETAEQSVAGITGVDAAIAETGSLVMGSSRPGANAPGRGRTVGLLPPLHIAIVRREQLVYSTVAVFRRLAQGPMPSQLIFASGPSRSADIENDLSIGVHGPKQVHVIIV